MGRRNILRPHQILTDADSTLDPISKNTDISGLDNITHLIKVDASVIGEIFVEFSLEESQDPQVFDPLSFGEPLALNGSVETVYSTKIQNHGFKWMRLRFENNSGTGLLNAYISGNTVGA